jgi:hemerythrin
MPLLSCEGPFLLGIGKFDEHHKHLISLLNDTYDLFIEGGKDSQLEEVLDGLIDYATYHFSLEEAWMRGQEYPQLAEHVLQHEDFSRRVKKFQMEFANGRSTVTLEVLSFLQRWLIDHIKYCDGKYVALLGQQAPM